MGSKRVIVLGASFAGLTAALELKARLRDRHEVLVVAQSDEFLFGPSLVWVPFGRRERQELTFPVRPALEAAGARFKLAQAVRLDLDARQLETPHGLLDYDYLVLATGSAPEWGAVRGLGPRDGVTCSIWSWEEAERTREAVEHLYRAPGPVVVGAVQGASDFVPAYEFLFNLAHQLQARGLARQAPLTFVTPEPFLCHFGTGGFGNATRLVAGHFRRYGIDAVTDAVTREITPGVLHLEGGEELRFSLALLAPPRTGAPVVAACRDIANARGFVEVDGCYRTRARPEVYACGEAVAVAPPLATPVPCAVPKSGHASVEMARVAAHNVAAAITGARPLCLPFESIDARAVLDEGNTGVLLASERQLEPRQHAWLLPGPEAHWAKVAYERFFLASRSRGRS